MSEFQTGRFDARTYESAKNFLSKNTHGDSVGLAAIIEGQKKGKTIQNLESQNRPKEIAETKALIESLEITTPGNNNTTFEHKPFFANNPLFKTPQQKNSPQYIQPQNTHQSFPPKMLSPINNPLQGPEKQLQDIREKFAKMPLEINGKTIDLNIAEFSFEKQANGGYKVIHPKLESVSDTPIHIDAQGNFQTQSLELKGWKLRLIGIEPGTYSISQKPDRLLIAKK